MIPESEWKWFGNAAHLCVASMCQFHMATLVGEYVVSTVGEYVSPYGKPGEFEDIGWSRKYETMVFKAAGETCRCGCGLPEIELTEIDSFAYNDAAAANSGHAEMCKRYASMSA